MDIEKFYENVVLRDVLEYLVPGSVFLFGLALLIEAISISMRAAFSVFALFNRGGFFLSLVGLGVAYTLGHLLAELRVISFDRTEAGRTVAVLRKDPWIKQQLVHVLVAYLHLTEHEAEEVLEQPAAIQTVREVGRSIIHHRQSSLYREFVGRHSILSRFCRNMSVALTLLLILVVVAIPFAWPQLVPFFRSSPISAITVTLLLLFMLVGSIYLFSNRSIKLRRSMLRHTFEIWIVDFVELSLAEDKVEEARHERREKVAGATISQ